MMHVEVKVLKPNLYAKKVKNVYIDLEILDSETFSGDLWMNLKDDRVKPFYGQFESKEYLNEYGFILVCVGDEHLISTS